MLQKLACRMGMGESDYQKLQIPARPRWPVDAMSYILLDWFADEDETERKAVAFSAVFGIKLTKVAARRQVMYTSGRRGWDIGSDEIEKIIAEIMVTAGEMVAAGYPTEKQVKVIEYIMGQRQDTVRQSALEETTSRRLRNY